jgi:hypothetical protein
MVSTHIPPSTKRSWFIILWNKYTILLNAGTTVLVTVRKFVKEKKNIMSYWSVDQCSYHVGILEILSDLLNSPPASYSVGIMSSLPLKYRQPKSTVHHYLTPRLENTPTSLHAPHILGTVFKMGAISFHFFK